MAQFEGTISEFIKFIGGYTRNKVATLTRSYRKNIGKCEECGSRTIKLDAAHIKEKARPIITSNILNNFIYNGIIKIDLQDFEDQFIQAHLPLKNSIRILCKNCHGKYDRLDSNFVSIIDGVDTEEIELKEIEIVSTLISNSVMNKSKALEFIRDKVDVVLDNNNVVYSNVNNTVNVWWLEPNNDKFKSGFYIILNNSNGKKLFLFRIPNMAVVSPELVFEQRSDKEASKVIIPVSISDFRDKNGFSFNPFLIQTIDY